MRLLWLAILSTCIAVPAARAGIYLPGEEPDIPFQDGQPQPLPFDAFNVILKNYSASETKRKEYESIRTNLTARGERRTMDETIKLSAVLLRLRDPSVQNLLQAARGRDPQNFVVLCHLAMGFHQHGEILDAVRYLDAALSLRKPEIAGFSPAQTAWYLRVEKILLSLLKGRMREQRDLGRRASVESVDPVFPASFVGDSNAFEPGKMAASEKAKLPQDALAVVQQLVLWMPDDARLYWLLAEIYNALGDLRAAERIFDECIGSRRFNPEMLRAHRTAVKDALAQQNTPSAVSTWRDHREVLWIGVGLAALVLIPLGYWQVRELIRRRARACGAGH